MIKRCYSEKSQQEQPTYKGCTVIDEWLTYSKFKIWALNQLLGENGQLDKDLLVRDNKIYSPNTCIYIPQALNLLLITTKAKNSNLPLGVIQNKNKHNNTYGSQISFKGKHIFLGTYNTPKEAHQSYLKAKKKAIKYYMKKIKEKNIKSALKIFLKEFPND